MSEIGETPIEITNPEALKKKASVTKVIEDKTSEKPEINGEFPNSSEVKKINSNEIPFDEFFGKSKVVDEEGNPKIVYHGSLQAFEEFDSNMENVSNQMGAGHYFTDSKEDLDANYTSGRDLEPKILSEANKLSHSIKENPDDYKEIVMGIFDISEEEATEKLKSAIDYDDSTFNKILNKIFFLTEDFQTKEIAKKIKEDKYKPTEGIVYPAYLRMENPVFHQKNGGTIFDQEAINQFRIYIKGVADKYSADEDKLLKPLNSSIKNSEVESWKFYNELKRSTDWFNIKNPKSTSPMTGQFFAEMCKNAGFDGLAIDAYDSFLGKVDFVSRKINGWRGKNMKGTEGTKHYVAWNSDQIRSTISGKGPQ